MGIEIKENITTTVTKKVVGTQISQQLYEQLKNEAESQFMSISDLLRKIIYLYYRDQKSTSTSVEDIEREIK